MLENIILLTDSYKLTHYKMYEEGNEQFPEGTTKVHSYLESRGGEFAHTVFFGLQYLIKQYLEGTRVTQAHIDQAKILSQEHFGQDLFNEAGWQHILDKHNGMLPVEIKAVPEGALVPVRTPLMTIENTDPECYWLTNHLETLLVQLWYPITVATISHHLRAHFTRITLDTGGSMDLLPFKLHDFGFRGSTSCESASIGGAAHLINFKGTDTIAGMLMLMDNYPTDDIPGFSVPAAEHSTITSWGESREADAFRQILKNYPSGLVSVVSDSWDIQRACRDIWGKELKTDVLERDGVVVVRPDSGEPISTILMCLNTLGDAFGYTVNDRGYKTLNDKVRLIQGDGISRHSLPHILESIKQDGWCIDNIVFGSGGGLLQDCNRDTNRFAMKCSYTEVNGKGRDVFKRPATDRDKNSKRGRQDSGMEVVFRNGVLMREQRLSDVRKIHTL